eukprot:CAMPEP_0198681434 /NCGR_PEP_ID=MMETSP1468-20131203/6793_1 /TAXON_ID=1461545 /ORGANISM="Mantoniella sp, Strain CCMP1436" /LENGTH=274 /DNA_ID=CAMNT_0044423123 /DNA_START=26 /DNA_END=850 /DNA_ORIENTATION=-
MRVSAQATDHAFLRFRQGARATPPSTSFRVALVRSSLGRRGRGQNSLPSALRAAPILASRISIPKYHHPSLALGGFGGLVSDVSGTFQTSRELPAQTVRARAAAGGAATPFPAEDEDESRTAAAAAEASDPAPHSSSAGSGKVDVNVKGLPNWLPMHDFCFTLPWGLFVALGGLAGFLIAGSTKSLIFGGGFGALLMGLGVLSLKKWKAGGSSLVYTVSSLLISTALAVVMGKKWLAGGSFIPSGLIAVGAVLMDLFYVHNMLTGGNPPRSKSE